MEGSREGPEKEQIGNTIWGSTEKEQRMEREQRGASEGAVDRKGAEDRGRLEREQRVGGRPEKEQRTEGDQRTGCGNQRLSPTATSPRLPRLRERVKHVQPGISGSQSGLPDTKLSTAEPVPLTGVVVRCRTVMRLRSRPQTLRCISGRGTSLGYEYPPF